MPTIKEFTKVWKNVARSCQNSNRGNIAEFILTQFKVFLHSKPIADYLSANHLSLLNWLQGDIHRWPLQYSRIVESYHVSALSDYKPNSLFSAAVFTCDVVWKCITVRAGECPICGDDLVYYWSDGAQTLVLSCDQCTWMPTADGKFLDYLNRELDTVEGILQPPTLSQLQKRGICGEASKAESRRAKKLSVLSLNP